jgi:hypothetical protein
MYAPPVNRVFCDKVYPTGKTGYSLSREGHGVIPGPHFFNPLEGGDAWKKPRSQSQFDDNMNFLPSLNNKESVP